MSRRWKWLIGIPVLMVVLATGGTWLYINVLSGDPPERLTLSSDDPSGSSSAQPSAASTPATTGSSGRWTVTDESVAGYRVREVLFGQDATAVGRTNGVTGELTLQGSTVTTATFTVDMTSVKSDQSRRDNQYRGRIMSTDEFPTSTFVLTSPIALGSLPADGADVSAKATGDLTLRGITRSVTFDVEAQRSGTRMEITGNIPVEFDDFEIPSPSFGPAEVEDHGSVEFLLVLAAA
jgi:polyisoprenoid-binding protein YceI